MDDKLKELKGWAEQMQSQLGDYKKYMDNVLKDLPKEEKDKFNQAFNEINIKELQDIAHKSTLNIINNIKSKM